MQRFFVRGHLQSLRQKIFRPRYDKRQASAGAAPKRANQGRKWADQTTREVPERNPPDLDKAQEDQRNVQVRLSASAPIFKQKLG